MGRGRHSAEEPDREEIRGAQVAALTALLLIAQQVAGKAARDTLFLSSFPTSYLPIAMAGGAMLSLATALWLSRAMVERAPGALMPLLFGASAAGFAASWALSVAAPRAAALLLYFQTAMLGPAMISTFWSMINERFDPHTAKRAVARISGGGALGGLLGGLATWRASSHMAPSSILPFLALVNVAALGSTVLTRKRRPASLPQTPSSDAAPVSPLATLGRVPFLRNLGVLVALGAAMSAMLDYVFSVQATHAFGAGAPLLAFFSLFWLVVGVASFALQATLGRVALEKLGLAINVAILPAVIVLGGALGLAVPGMASAALLRGAEAVQRNTLFRSAYELFYAPVPDQNKRATKALIDVGCDRLGTVCGSAISLLVLHGLAQGHSLVLLLVVVLLALFTLPWTRKLHLGYVEALQQGLREGAAKLGDPEHAGAPPSQAPSRLGQRVREQLIQKVEDLHPGGLSALVDANGSSADTPSAPPNVAAAGEASLGAARELFSTDAQRVQRALDDLQPHQPAVACVISLLAHPEWHGGALKALAAQAPHITGQLLDALLDPETDFTVRRRVPRALSECSTQRAADGLLLGTADERFEVRYECARALLQITSANPEIVVSEAHVVAALRREVESSRLLDDRSSEGTPHPSVVGDLMLDRANRSLEHVFTVLSLVLEREPLRLAFKALHHREDKYRGTALEYLDAVLTSELREIVWPYLGEGAPLPTARPARELLADLAQLGE